MNFRPELAAKVMAGEKTVTRRLVSDNPRSPWWVEKCGLQVGKTYAVCPGRGKHAIGRVEITRVSRVRLDLLTPSAALKEGFRSPAEFKTAWKAINGNYDMLALVWRVEFRVADERSTDA